MEVRKSQGHMLLVPVLLILVAAFLATSLSFDSGKSNELTGAAVNAAVSGRCSWYAGLESNTNETVALCPNSRPTAISGGCTISNSPGSSAIAKTNVYSGVVNGTSVTGWVCGSEQSIVRSISASALCCKI